MEICICFGIFCKLNLYEKKKREFTQYNLYLLFPSASGRSENLKEHVKIQVIFKEMCFTLLITSNDWRQGGHLSLEPHCPPSSVIPAFEVFGKYGLLTLI